MYSKYGLDKIDHERQELLDQLIGTLHSLLDKLREGEPFCSFECDSMLLGALIKQLYPQELIWPRPLKPFTGFQFAETAEAVRRFQSPAWCVVQKKKKLKQRSAWDIEEEVQKCPQHGCNLQNLLIPDIDRLKNGVKGLDLEEI
jgi:hypothetical protein